MQLADDTDRVAVLRFDSQVEGVGNLGTLQQVGDANNRSRLVSTLIAPTNYNFRGYTRMDLALEQATALLASVKEPGRSQYILLLTDGEPSQPSGAGLQRPRVEATVQTLRADDVLAFPVVLCNPNAGCAGEFLRARFDQELVREAKTAGDLLQVFSQIFAEIKRDRSVITDPTGGGTLQFTTRPSQAVQQISLITPRGGLAGIDLDGAPVVTAGLLDDPNIELNTVSVSPLPAGAWTVRTTDPSGFTVIQADSYPELLFPPASVADSSASVRYFPAGKPPLIVARGVGPGAGEASLLQRQRGFGPHRRRQRPSHPTEQRAGRGGAAIGRRHDGPAIGAPLSPGSPLGSARGPGFLALAQRSRLAGQRQDPAASGLLGRARPWAGCGPRSMSPTKPTTIRAKAARSIRPT